MSVSWPQFSSDIAADISTIALDIPGSGYDRLHQLLQQRVLPGNRAAQLAISAIGLVASRLAQQRLGPTGPVGNFVREVTEDGVREEVKRIIEHVRSGGPIVTAGPEHLAAPFWELDPALRTQILEYYESLEPQEQQRLREYLSRASAMELTVLAGLPREHQRLLLSIVAPPPPSHAPLASRVGATVDNTCCAIARVICPWAILKE